ncbi:MAG: aldehyde dehydrogenase family protein, partial [Pseudonocardiaceae bacterium]
AVSQVAVPHRDLAGIHFTGSTGTFQRLWGAIGANIAGYRSYPRIVGETGGKDFVIVHPSAGGMEPQLRTALVRGAFEYQGQKCSAASRAYVPRSIWAKLRDDLVATTNDLSYGGVTELSHFGAAVIDRRSFDRAAAVLGRLAADPACRIIAGGTSDDRVGYFVRPTIVECDDPAHEMFTTEYFAPILAVHVFDDTAYDDVVAQAAEVAPYALTGAVWASEQAVISRSLAALRYSAGNVYVNDKPTGSVVGQQPFGGARASGTNDKAGSIFNMMRWVSPRVIKETFSPPTEHRYPHMG